MTKSILMERYPIFSHEIKKEGSVYQSVDSIISELKKRVEQHPVATYITVFDHYKHTSSLNDGTIAEEIIDAKNLIFCFGKQIPTTKIVAVRPRSVGVCELHDSFMIEFMEAPNEQLQKTLEEWVIAL